MSKFETRNWTENEIIEYFKDIDISRSPHPKELILLHKFIKKHQCKNIFDLGTWMGVSGYIISTSYESINNLISMDWCESHSIEKYGVPLRNESVYGKYLPINSIFIKSNYKTGMDKALKDYNIDFAFLDNGHGYINVLEEIQLCKLNKVKYIAIHDTSKGRMPREAMLKHIQRKNYKLVCEDLVSSPTQGISFLEII